MIDAPPIPSESPQPAVRRRLVLVTAGVIAIAAVAGWHYLSERPLRQAEYELQAGRPDLTVEITDGFLEDHPSHSRAAALKARALVASGRPQQAIELFDRVGAATTADLHAWARAYLHLEQFSVARPLLEQVAQQNPGDLDVHHELAACYANLGRYREALESARTFTRRSTDPARGELMIGTLHRDMGNLQQAAESYARVLELEPTGRHLQVAPHEFLHAYGKILLDLGRTEEAADSFERSLAAMISPEALSDYGRSLERLGRVSEAEAAWQQVLTLDFHDRVAREGLAAMALRRQDAAAALDILRPLTDDAKPRASTAYLLQRAYAVAGDAAHADRWQERASSLRADEQLRATINRVMIDSPNSPWADVLRAYQAAEENRWGEAEIMLARVAFDDPFVLALRAAVGERGTLPPLKDLPISQF